MLTYLHAAWTKTLDLSMLTPKPELNPTREKNINDRFQHIKLNAKFLACFARTTFKNKFVSHKVVCHVSMKESAILLSDAYKDDNSLIMDRNPTRHKLNLKR